MMRSTEGAPDAVRKTEADSSAPLVAIVGAGAVGCYYGGMLARAGVPVRLIGRRVHVDAILRDGLRVTTAVFDERIPVQASTEPAAVAGAKLVLVCVKSTDTETTARSLAPHLDADACVLSLQNGVDNAERLQALLGRTVAPVVVYVASEMGGPGHVRHMGRGELVIATDIGAEASPMTSATGALADDDADDAMAAANAAASLNAMLAPVAVAAASSPMTFPITSPMTSANIVTLFARAGIPVELSDNVAGALWGKLVLNCGYNALSAITDLPYGRLVTSPGMAQTVRHAVLECLAVAQALRVTLPGDIFAAVDRIAQTMPGQVSSTCQDLRRGKPTEIDHLNGFVADEGERLGVATPINRALHSIVRALEARAAFTGTPASGQVP
jgi:2-dehydropantoate 2-reductase